MSPRNGDQLPHTPSWLPALVLAAVGARWRARPHGQGADTVLRCRVTLAPRDLGDGRHSSSSVGRRSTKRSTSPSAAAVCPSLTCSSPPAPTCTRKSRRAITGTLRRPTPRYECHSLCDGVARERSCCCQRTAVFARRSPHWLDGAHTHAAHVCPRAVRAQAKKSGKKSGKKGKKKSGKKKKKK